MSVLITGAAGFIGSHVAERLLAGGGEVVALDSFDAFYDRSVKERNLEVARDHGGCRVIEGDIRDAELLASLPDHVECVIHLAALAGVRPSIERPREYAEVNVGGTAALLDFARARGIGRFVLASSSSVYGDSVSVPFREDARVDHPISPYAASKRAAELLAHTHAHLFGMTVLALRFFTVYGPRQRPDLAIHKFAALLRAGEPIPVFGDGSTERDYTYIDDIVDGVESAVDYTSREPSVFDIVNLGESRTIALSEMIETLSTAMGIRPTIERRPLQPGDVLRTCADISKAERLFGYRPRREFASGIECFVNWFDALQTET